MVFELIVFKTVNFEKLLLLQKFTIPDKKELK